MEIEARPGSRSEQRRGNGRGTAMARGLGWFSIGLGVAEVTAPRRLGALIGVDHDRRSRDAMRAMGAREIAHGVGILSSHTEPAWVWSRVAGDVLDLALLGWALRTRRRHPERLAIAIASVLAVTVLDVMAARRTQRQLPAPSRPVIRAITINRAPDEVYEFWRNLDQLPLFMSNLESVEMLADGRSHWTVKGPAGRTVEWDAELVEDEPGHRIAWRSLPGADIDNRGRVTFRPAPGGRGTEVKVELLYRAPAGRLGETVAKLFGKEPGQEIAQDLRRLKQVLETGEVVYSDASIHARPHPARPSAEIGALP